MAQSGTDFEKLLQVLVGHGVEFVVVGGVAAVLQGAPIMTLDLDIVHRRDPSNVNRLLNALEDLGAYYRNMPERRLVPTRSHLMSQGHQLLLTKFGALDLLGTIGSGRSYGDLLPLTLELEIEELHVRILSLNALIQVKQEVDQPKDRAVLEILRETLRESGDA
ncbi:MAG TPA: hypothetical protein VMY18_07580 [Acidobacteriota bacterium]|nr:hypothetical protein [Acidobacteriota bacterium]